MSFATDTQVTDQGGVLRAEVARRWEVWGPNGGYLSAIALRAVALRAPAGHRPASISVQYLNRGVFGAAELRVEPLKLARNAACLAVELWQEERRTLVATVWTTDKTDGPAYRDAAPPAVPGPEALADFDTYLEPGRKMAFWDNFDARPVAWPWPGTPDPRGHVFEQWMRFKGHVAGRDAWLDQARALLLIDTMLWPAHWRGEPPGADYAAPSLDVTAWFHAPGEAADWLLAQAHTPVAGGGLIHGHARIWSEDGQLIASGGSQLLHLPLRR
jgi:acyl-CoA thioesterase II